MATYYVATTGSNSDPGSENQPWLTIQYAVNQAAAGDTIIVEDGEYNESVSCYSATAGTSANEITLQTRNRHGAVINGQYTYPTGGTQAYVPGSYAKSSCIGGNGTALDNIYEALIYLVADYWIVDGFVVENSRGSGISMNDDPTVPDSITVKNCIVRNCRMYGILLEDATNITVEDCTVHGCGNFAPFSRGSSVLNWPSIVYVARCDTVTLDGLDVYDNWGEGITIVGTDITLENSKVHNNFALQIYATYIVDAIIQNNLVWQASDDDTYWRNCEPSAGIVINMEAAFKADPNYPHTDGVDIRNNLIVGCNSNISFWDNENDGALIAQNVRVYNNTLIAGYDEAVGFVGNNLAAFYQTCYFVNNLIFQPNQKTTSYNTFATTDIDFDYNLWPVTPNESSASGANDVIGDPDLNNPVTAIPLNSEPSPANYKISYDSPAKDVADNTRDATIDYFGDSRPVNTTSDIGFHEHDNVDPGGAVSDAPYLTSPGTQTDTVGVAASLTVTRKAGGAYTTQSASGLPPGITLTAERTFSGSPTTSGTYNVSYTFSTNDPSTETIYFTWTVSDASAYHITLDGRGYQIVPEYYQKQPDNPFAAKLGQGAGSYDDLEGWSAFVMDDWRAGAGKTDPQDGGFLAGTMDTRYANRMLLPPRVDLVDRSNDNGSGGSLTYYGAFNQEVTLGNLESYRYIAFAEQKGGLYISTVSIFMESENASSVGQSKSEPLSGGVPPALSTTSKQWRENNSYSGVAGSIGEDTTITHPKGAVWHQLNTIQVLTSTNEFNVLRNITDTPLRIPLFDATGIDTWVSYDGETWTTLEDVSPGLWWGYGYTVTPFIFKGVVHFYAGGGTGSETASSITRSGDVWTHKQVGKTNTGNKGKVRSVEEFGGKYYIAKGSLGLEIYNESYLQDSTQTSALASILLRWNNLLYRAYENDVYYTSNGTSWSGPFQVGPDGYEIRGMAGVGNGNDILVSTDDGLFVFAEGDTSYGVAPWPTRKATNGVGMIHHQGSVYIPVDNRIVRYDNGSLLDIWFKDDENRPDQLVGRPSDLCSMGGILYAVTDCIPNPFGGVFGWNGQGWQHIATLRQWMPNPVMVGDRDNSCLWVGTRSWPEHEATKGSGRYTGPVMRIPLSDYGVPLSDPDHRYTYSGWIETDWFDGGLVELDKDMESVYINGDGFSTAQYIEVYWQDDDSSTWEQLGTITADETELRWSDFATRPNTKRIKLGFRVVSEDATKTPEINGIRLKYQTLVGDRWRWQLPIEIARQQELLDGSLNPYTVAQMLDHIENNVIKSVPPLSLIDIDGATYEVRVKQASQQIQKFEYINSQRVYDCIYYLTVAEV